MSVIHKVYESYHDLPDIWNNHFGKAHAMHADELKITEIAQVAHMQFYYVISYSDNKPVLFSYYQLLHVTPQHFNCKDKIFQHYSLNVSLRTVKPTLLVVGNLFRHDETFFQFLPNALPLDEQQDFFIKTFEYILNYSKGTGIFLKDIPEFFAKGIQETNTYNQFDDDVSMEMNLPSEWTSMVDYEKTLKHKYHQRFAKIKKQEEGLVIKKLSEEDVIKYSNDIEALYLQVTNNQLVSMGKINQEFVILLKKQLKENYVLFGWFLDDKMVAFSSAILHQGAYDMNYIGFDYTVNQSHAIYFNILFHCLEQAILTRSQKLVLGRTALEVKAILGCEPAYQYSFYKLRNVVVNWFFKKVSAGFKEQIGEKWKDRHPFKSSYYKQKELIK